MTSISDASVAELDGGSGGTAGSTIAVGRGGIVEGGACVEGTVERPVDHADGATGAGVGVVVVVAVAVEFSTGNIKRHRPPSSLRM